MHASSKGGTEIKTPSKLDEVVAFRGCVFFVSKLFVGGGATFLASTLRQLVTQMPPCCLDLLPPKTSKAGTI